MSHSLVLASLHAQRRLGKWAPIGTAQCPAAVAVQQPSAERAPSGAASGSAHRGPSTPNLQAALAEFHVKKVHPFFREGVSPLLNLIETVTLICKGNTLS